MFVYRFLPAIVLAVSACAAAAEQSMGSATFEPFELKPLGSPRYVETVQFGSSIDSIATSSRPLAIQIVLRRTGESQMRVEGPFVRERIEVSQTTVQSNIPDFDEEWEQRHVEEWMRLRDGRIRLFHSTENAHRQRDEDNAEESQRTLSMMAEMSWNLDLLAQLMATPVLGTILDEGGRPFPVDTRQARIRISDWLSPSIEYGIRQYGDTPVTSALASDTGLFGLWMTWKSSLRYRGMVEEGGNRYLRFTGDFSGSFSLPDTEMTIGVATVRPMELLIDSVSGHEKYRQLDCGIIAIVEDQVLRVRNIRERTWTLSGPPAN